jgi:uncharacterized protein (DUF58 family)
VNLAATLTPPAIEAAGLRKGRIGVAFGSRFFVLLVCGLVWLAPGFLDRRFLWGILAWDVLLLLGWLYDLVRLPRPEQLSATRQWSHPVALAVESRVELRLENRGSTGIYADVMDDFPLQLRDEVPVLRIAVKPGKRVSGGYDIVPGRRGNAHPEAVYIRYESPWRLAQRWSRVPLAQTIRVYPNLDEAKSYAMYMVRSRQIEMQKRYSRMRGAGRDFESLREYREGDELRNVCWTASARRGKLVTKTFQIERSQTIWLVLDCGRLMRTRVGSISKLDSAVNTALTLSEVALGGGDRVGLLAYGRAIQQRILPGRGGAHLRLIMEQLTDVREESAEADHLRAVSALMSLQKRRSLVIWLTDLAETSMTPEVVDAAMLLVPLHLVLFAVIGQRDLSRTALLYPSDADAMYQAAAAQEMMHRRELLLARMHERGVLALDVNYAALTTTLVNTYLEIASEPLARLRNPER